MDTNINNYNVRELLHLIKLPEEECILDNVYDITIDILQQVNANNEIELPNKNVILAFFHKCFYKICNNYRFYPTEKMDKSLSNLLQVEEVRHDTFTKDEPYIGSLPPKIPEISTIGVNPDLYSRGLVNPLKRETIKNTLVINSKFFVNSATSNTSTDFSVILKEPYNNVVSLKLASMELMNSYYPISDYLKTNRFTIETYKLTNSTNVITDFYSKEIQISEGSYNANSIYPIINAILAADPSLNMVTTTYNTVKGKILFFLNPSPVPLPPAGKTYAFNLSFTVSHDPTRYIFLNMGWLFGYTKSRYNFLTDYVSTATTTQEIGFNPEAPLDFTGTKYFLLEVTDYNNNAPAVLKYPAPDKYSFTVKDILAKVPNVSSPYSIIFEDSSDRVFKTRNYFGPVKLQKLRIRLLDENGIVVNLNNSTMAITFEVETLEIPYKNMVK